MRDLRLPIETVRKDVLDQIPQQPFKATVKAINLIKGSVKLQIAGSSAWQWYRCLEGLPLDHVSVGQEAVITFFGGEPVVMGFLPVGGRNYKAPIHTHEKDAEGGQLDWDDIWSDAIHGHTSAAEGGLVGGVGVAVYSDVANVVASGGFGQALIFNQVRWDDANFWNVANPTRLTVPAGYAGRYTIDGHVNFVANGAGTVREIGISLNVVGYIDYRGYPFTAGRPAYMGAEAVYDLAAGNILELWVYQDSGGNLNTGVLQAYSCEFRMERK